MPALTFEEILKYNHNHGADGKFTTSEGAGSGGTSRKITEYSTDAYYGQVDMRMESRDGENLAGYMQYSVYDDTPNIQYIQTEEGYRGQGVATEMLQRLQSQYPDKEINWGMTTPDGTKLKEKVTYEVRDEKVTRKKKRLQSMKDEISRNEAEMDDLWEKADGRDFTDSERKRMQELGSQWDKLNRDIHDAEQDLEGKKEVRYMVRMPKDTKKSATPTGCGVLVVRDGKILTGTRIERAGKGRMCGPGGHIEPGETPEEAAKRETWEEFGIVCDDLKPLGVQDGGNRYGSSAVFLCTKFSGTPKTDEEEMTDPTWRTVEEIREENLFPPFEQSLELLPTTMAKSFNEILKYNHNHAADGKFTTAEGAGAGSGAVSGVSVPKGLEVSETDAELFSGTSWDDFMHDRNRVKESMNRYGKDPHLIEEKWYYTNLSESAKGVHEISDEECSDIVGDNIPDRLLSGWFRNADSGYKPIIETATITSPELRNAALNIAHKNYNDFLDGQGKDPVDFDTWLTTPITLYRGDHGQEKVADDVFMAYSYDRKISEKFGSNIEEIQIRPIDTLGSYRRNGEWEVMVPSREFGKKVGKSAEELQKGNDMNEFEIFKTDEDKHLVFGWASVAITVDGEVLEDRQHDMIEPEDLEEAAYEYVLNFRDTGEEHLPGYRKKGKLVESCVLTAEKQKAMGIPEGVLPVGWWIGFKIEDDDTWQRVKNGTYKMFSIEGRANREPIEKAAYDEWLEENMDKFSSEEEEVEFREWKSPSGFRARTASDVDEIDMQWDEYKKTELKKTQKAQTFEEVLKYNHNHGADGKFTSNNGGGGGAGGATSTATAPADTSYQISHRPPTKEDVDNGEADYAYKIDSYCMPGFYDNPQNYDFGEPGSDESIRTVMSIRNKPDAEVTVYRGAPKGELNDGDWVSLSRTYAEQYAGNGFYSSPGAEVHSFKVKAKDLTFEGNSINEFGYRGETVRKGVPMNKYDEIIELEKRYDEIEEVQKFNQNHDALGRFSTASGAASVTIRTRDSSKQSLADRANAKAVANSLVSAAKAREPKLTSTMKSLAKDAGGEMAGLEFAVKTEGSLARKLKTESKETGLPVGTAAKNMKDVNRYTMVLKEDNFVDGFDKTMKALQSQGYEIVKVKNTLKNPTAEYRGVNTNLKDPDGSIFELQFHTQKSLDVKEPNHLYYEEQRLDTTSPERKKELGILMAKNAASITTPKNIEKIKDVQFKG